MSHRRLGGLVPPSRALRLLLIGLSVASLATVGLTPTGAAGLHGAPMRSSSSPTVPRSHSTEALLHSFPGGHAAIGAGGPAAGHVPLSSKPQWWDVTNVSVTPLPVIEFTQGTWDSADGSFLVYGGDNYVTPLNGTWSYADGEWTSLSTHGNPGAISGGSLAYDASDGYTVFYGGVTSFSPLTGNNTTYTYAAGSWTPHVAATHPPVQVAGTMAYDPSLAGDVLFGGAAIDGSGVVYNQTWLYHAGAWSELSPAASPPGRWQAEMTFDPALNEMVLFGGYDALGNALGDTWVFANGTWSSVSAGGLGVPSIGDGVLVYDPDLGGVILAGGQDQFANPEVGTWEFDGSVWSIAAALGTPHAHIAAVGGWDPVDHELLLAAGDGFGNPSYTNVLSLPLSAVNVTSPRSTDVGVPTHFDAQGAGGAPPYTYSWNWGDDSSNNTANATHVYTRAETYVITLTIHGPASGSATWQQSISVAADPVPVATLQSKGIDVGFPAEFTASAGGGVGPYTYHWALTDGLAGNGSVFNVTFQTAGQVGLNLSTTDAVGGVSSHLYNFLVNATPSVGVAPINVPEAGTLTSFQAALAGGVPPFTYAWAFSGGGTSSAAQPSHRFADPGTQWANVSITDSNGAAAFANTSVLVVPTVAITIGGPSSAISGATLFFTTNVTEGTAPFVFNWTLPNGAVANGTSATFYFPGTGTFTVSATVTDANGAVATSTHTVSITSGSSSILGGTLGGVPTVAVVGGAVALVIVIAIAAVIVGRRRPPAEPAPGPAPEPDAAPVDADAAPDPGA